MGIRLAEAATLINRLEPKGFLLYVQRIVKSQKD